MEEIQQLAVGVFFLLEQSEKLWLHYSPLSDYRLKTILYVFPPLFIIKAVSVRDYQPTQQFQIVVNVLGSVVGIYSVPSLKYLCRVSEFEELTLAY